MIEIGKVALLFSVILSFYTIVVSYLGYRQRLGYFLESSRRAMISSFALLTIAITLLSYALVTKNYEIKYVAENVSNNLPAFYAFSALWAGQSGSLLLWAWLLNLFIVIVIFQNRDRHLVLMPYVIATLAGILLFFMVLLAFFSNPFERLGFTVMEGQGLNPLLQNPGMMFHPPTLYLGYVGFSVPFAFAIAALLTRKLDSEWIVSTRRWTIFSWLLLTIGIVLGAKWAYVELGWGGYWGWDPVENASFMPWLTGTAFLHSIMIQERKGMLKIWNVSLIIITFLLTILGTFITRSGIIASVHSFGASKLGYVFIVFLVTSAAFSLYLILTRKDELRSENKLDSFLSRESSFLFNNWILVGAAFAIFWGTLFPVISEAVRGVKITVGPPFFNTITIPIGILLILITGICPLISWRKATLNNFIRNFLYPGAVFVLLLIGLLLAGIRNLYALMSFSLIGFVLTSIVMEFYRGVKARRRYDPNVLVALKNLVWKFRRRYGGYIVHVGVMLAFVGITGSSAFSTEKDQILKKGEIMTIKNYQLKFLGVDQFRTANAEVLSASFEVYQDGKRLGILNPSKHYHPLQDQTMTEVAIRSTWKEDLYLILGGVQSDGSVFLKVHINPLVSWIWWGTYILIVGALIAMWPGRRPVASSAGARKAVQPDKAAFDLVENES
ncbi:MAG: heme lyase CcmF/NrfE family subunit [Calditrichaeota bacterium]|nr:heme lyase CcmF/NrfE family subunit [Calditrichota bacterium]